MDFSVEMTPVAASWLGDKWHWGVIQAGSHGELPSPLPKMADWQRHGGLANRGTNQIMQIMSAVVTNESNPHHDILL